MTIRTVEIRSLQLGNIELYVGKQTRSGVIHKQYRDPLVLVGGKVMQNYDENKATPKFATH